MKTISLYDPAMCCSSGICGPAVDPVLPRVAGMLAQLKASGVHVERYNLSQQPSAFVENGEVRELLDREGVEALPLTFIDGVLALKGRYPDDEMRELWLREHAGNPAGANLPENQQTQTENRKPPIADEGQSGEKEPLKQEASTCGPGCGCNTSAKPAKTRWVIGVLVLTAAGALAVRAVSKTGAVAPEKPTPAFSALATSPTLPGGGAPTAAAQTEAGIVGTPIGALSELNALAAQTDAALIFLPGKEAAAGLIPSAQMKDAAGRIESKDGLKCGLFTLKPDSPDYDQIAAQMSVPGVLVMVRGAGMNAISGDITETKLVQGFLSASSAGGCGGGGCGPASAGCK
jgi:hypothetical protein